ncbi:MAG: TIR domain-containing protein [Verrucomicrobiales bacterium]|nr:TIR domain-containing protein [Verrucomicrobiales bacterium]
MDPSTDTQFRDSAPAMEPAADVFLSYNSRDRAIVEEIANRLAGLQVRPFFDRWDLPPGLRWRHELEVALAECRSVAVCLGPEGLGEVQKREVDVALQRQYRDAAFPVIPVILPGGEAPKGFLEGETWIDLRIQPIEDGVAALARAIRRQPGDAKVRRATRLQRNRYLFNLGLLLVVFVGAVGWYDRHLQARVSHWALGGSLTAVTLAKLVYDYLRWGADDELKNLPKRLLGSRPATRILTAAMAGIGILLAMTSSLQVRVDADLPPGDRPVIEVKAGGKTLWTSPPLGADRTATSRLFFFRGNFDAEVHWVNANDRGVVPIRLGLGRRAEIRVPSQFPARRLEVTRLLPGAKFLHAVGAAGERVNLRYDLEVITGESTQRVADVRRQPVYLARSAEDVDLGMRRETPETRRRRFESWAGERGRSQVDLTQFWDGPPRLVILGEAVAIESLKFRLRSENQAESVALRSTVADATNEVRTVILEKEP